MVYGNVLPKLFGVFLFQVISLAVSEQLFSILFPPILIGGCAWILASMCLCGTIETGRGVVGGGLVDAGSCAARNITVIAYDCLFEDWHGSS